MLEESPSYSPKEFGPLRELFWPIHGFEIKKFLPMAIMMFCVLFNYTILRNSKDALAVTAAGPEVIPFLKGWVIMPISILFVTAYAKISNVLSRENVFYVIILSFVCFFAVFSLYLYPNQMNLQPDPAYISQLKLQYPHFQHLISVYALWTFSLFYLFSELWGAIALGLLFWQFANEITTTLEARRFYTMFAFLGHFALLAAGMTVKTACSSGTGLDGFDGCGVYIDTITGYFLVSSAVMLFIYWWMNRNVLTDPRYYAKAGMKAADLKKPKLSLRESFGHIIKSKYIGLIAILVLGYGLSQNLIGYMWKRQIKMQFPNMLDYANFMGDFSLMTGVVTISLIFFSKNLVNRFGWFRGAIATPLVLLTTVSIFLSFIFFDGIMGPAVVLFGVTPLFMSVWTGTAQQILSKSSKYALFDPTKEMAYIPLDDDLKVKGKAAVDVAGHTFSKASGGYIASLLLIITGAADFSLLMPYFAIIVFVAIAVWIIAVRALRTRYQALTKTSV
jgi:AAA family ATP:ADP antiporter